MNRIEKMNEVRSICGYEPVKRSFFYRDEIVEVIEVILGRELSEEEQGMSIKALVKTFLPDWKEQSTAVSHPSVDNIDYILELLSEEVSEEEVSEEDNTDCCIAEVTTSPVMALTDFIIQGLNEKFSHNILAVSVCANDPKQFTITLK